MPDNSALKPKHHTHLAYLDGLRALAALYVVLHHALLQIDIFAASPLLKSFPVLSNPAKMYEYIFMHGRFAVDIFIVISGFSLMLPVINNDGQLNKGIPNFLIRRAKRILPAYYLSILFSLLLIYTVIGEKTGTHWDVTIPVTKFDILTHLLLIHDFFVESGSKINHVYWSVAIEWRIYFLFPVLLFFWYKLGPFYTTCSTALISIIIYILLYNFNLKPEIFSPHYLGLFALGMYAAYLSFTPPSFFIKISKNLYYKIIFLIATTLLIFLVSAKINITEPSLYKWFNSNFHTGFVSMDFAVGLYAAFILSALASGKFKVLHSLLSWKPLVFTGTFAYSIYLIHAPLLQLFTKYIIFPFNRGASISILLFVFISVPFIIGVSYIFSLVAERPFMAGKKHITLHN